MLSAVIEDVPEDQIQTIMFEQHHVDSRVLWKCMVCLNQWVYLEQSESLK